ncbi:MAG: UDP-N-acetylmuramate dehydrogenase [Bacteroidales bacterium]|nr:UDP-N-acetylmuramate dehydrogenase [Bacteroidales bacterium]
MQIIENYSLKHLNTFGIDARAKYFVELNSDEDIIDFVKAKGFAGHKTLILNGGSNTLFTKDFDGLVIKINNPGYELSDENNNHIFLKIKAGENWDAFVQKTIEQGYSGLENLSMIPGNAGAAPIQNIGAYGVEQKDLFHSLEAINRETGKVESFDKESCRFGYRSSIFKTTLKEKYIILAVNYRLNKKPVFNIGYGAIKDELKKMGSAEEISTKAIAQAVRNIRSSKLPDPEKIGNAGSFFKNPVIAKEKYMKLKNAFPDISAYPESGGKYKIAAGWMIDHLGWKGARRGDAGVCATQALVLVNYGNAAGHEIVALATEIQQSVKKTFGICLEPEVNIV